MLSDRDVLDLYRCLLGRAPEDAETVRAFRRFYADFARGRLALFNSAEFSDFYAQVTGKLPYGADDAAGELALALLKRAGAAAPALPVAAAPALAGGMRLMLGQLKRAKLAVVIGQGGGLALGDLVPFARPDAAVLQIAPDWPPVVPLTSTLPGGTALFRLGADPAQLAALLHAAGRRVDCVCLMGPPSSPAYVLALRSLLADRALILVGPQQADFPADAVSEAVCRACPGEPVVLFEQCRLHHLGGWHLSVRYAPPAAEGMILPKRAAPRIAVACIVRDEAACIENMLASVMPLACFVAVLDTGSTDGTLELARAFLDRHGMAHVIAAQSREAFGCDFSAMRNAAIDLVPREIPWVLMLDADEEIVPEDYAGFAALAASGLHDAYALPRYNFSGANKDEPVLDYPDRQVRLLRHDVAKPARYSGRVHETVRNIPVGQPPLDAAALGGSRGGPHIHHLVRRFRSVADEDRKQAFYRALMRQDA